MQVCHAFFGRHLLPSPPSCPIHAQVRELFSKLGVAGVLLDKVVKSISSSDDTLLAFMRKVNPFILVTLFFL